MFNVAREAYGNCHGQRYGRVPVDERLGLRKGEVSGLLDDSFRRRCGKESFAEAGRSREALPEPADCRKVF